MGGVPPSSTHTPDGFLLTGDKGSFDSDGYLTLVGRFKEIINRGGEKISPFEVEDAVSCHPSVHECVAFAVPHKEWGEVGLGVVLKQGSTAPSLAEMTNLCCQKMAQHKWPVIMRELEAIPKTASEKIKRIGLSELLGIDIQ